jgi:hypothetical protein
MQQDRAGIGPPDHAPITLRPHRRRFHRALRCEARGLGLGMRLVDECRRFAERAGYRKIVL